MFDTLDTIDWPSLETAYGTAAAIPAALFNLASHDGGRGSCCSVGNAVVRA
jgi:hypothetical protein